MSRFMCQREKGTDSLLFVFVDEDSEQDAVHRGAVLESAHGAGSSPDLPALDSVGGSDLSALIGVLEAGQQIVEIVAQACDGPGVCIFPAFGEAPGGAERSEAAPRRDALKRWRQARANGLTARAAANAVGVPRSTFYRWQRLADRNRLKPCSRRPHTPRRPTWSAALVTAVRETRADCPM